MPGPGKQAGSQKGKGGGFFSNLWGDIKNTAKRTAAAIKQEAVKAADKAGDAFRDAKQAAGQWWDKNKDTVKKVAIGVAAAVVIVGATVLTAGAAAGVMGAVAAGTMGVGAAAASMAVTGAAAAGASAIASTAASSSIRHYNATGSWSGAGQAATKASMEALPGAMAQGALLGGISGYGSALATANNPTGYVSTGGSSKGAWEGATSESTRGDTQHLSNGDTLTVNNALDAADNFLGKGYTDTGNGRFVSADGTRVVRMGDSDILGKHGGAPHMNFVTMVPNPAKPGKMQVVNNWHIYLKE